MAKFLLAYKGGGSMGSTPEEQQKVMEQWMNWFGSSENPSSTWGALWAPPAPSPPVGRSRTAPPTN
jgi:hypothetical protein